MVADCAAEPLASLHTMRRARTLDDLLCAGKILERSNDPSREDYLEMTLTDRGPVADPMNRLKVPSQRHASCFRART